MSYAKKLDWVLDMTVADFISRFPEAANCNGDSFFSDPEALSSGGVLLSVAEALDLCGINKELFALLCGKRLRRLAVI